MPSASIREILRHLRQVYSTVGGKMTVIILLVSGAILAGITIGLGVGSIKPLSGAGQNLVNADIFIFVFSFALAIFLLLNSNPQRNPKESPIQQEPQKIEDESLKPKIIKENASLLEKWSARISLGGIFLVAIVSYVLGWWFILVKLVLPTIRQITSGPISWEFGTEINTITGILLNLILFIIWVIMPFMAYIDNKKKHKKDRFESKEV